MCGISGIMLGAGSRDPARLDAVRAMADSLRHRGPDGEGIWIDPEAGVALGHRRLAILDLSDAGRQPMLSSSGRLVMSFNGEIYNFAELRTEFEAKGRTFRGRSDTEVLLAACEEFGIDAALRRCAGMFAIALWDRDRRVLHLARDRLGKKPLYVAVAPDGLIFASELKALHAFPSFHREVDAAALAMVLRQGWVSDSACIWKGVFKVPPGTCLTVRAEEIGKLGADALRRRAQTWWSLADVAAAGRRRRLGTVEEIDAELEALLRQAVHERMVADVPLGALLSGGIDSSLVVALMQAQSSRPVRTFTVGFEEARFDEGAAAGAVARQLGTVHEELRLSHAEARETVPELPNVWDEPFADESQIPTLLVSRLARQHVTVALSGDGGDEAFGGYVRHAVAARLSPALKLPVPVRRAGAAALHLLGAEAWDGLLRPFPLSFRRRLSGRNLQKFAHMLGAVDEADLYDRLTAFRCDPPLIHGPAQFVLSPTRVPDLADPTARMMYRDMASYLTGDILVKLDRASMAASLETRCPLLDHRVIEFAWRLPTAAKLKGGRGKQPLRRLLARHVPRALFERPKQGFDVPVGPWLRGPLRGWAEALIAPARLRRQGFFDAKRVETLWRQHLGGHLDRSGELWAVLMVQAWLEAQSAATRPCGLRPTFDDMPHHRQEPVHAVS